MANEDGQFTDEEVLKAQQDQSVALVYVRVNDSVVELGSTSASNVRVFGVSINASEARVNKLDRLFRDEDRKSTRLNSSHALISYAVFCLKKKKKTKNQIDTNTTNNEQDK